MQAYYNILTILKNQLSSDKFVNTVSQGDIFDIDLKKQTIFPLSHIIVNDATKQGNILVFNVSVLCMDIVDKSKEEATDSFRGNDNEQDVINTQMAVALRLVEVLERGGNNNSFMMRGEPTFEPFTERFENYMAGVTVTFDIHVPNTMSACDTINTPDVCKAASYLVEYADGTDIESGTIPSGGSATIVIPDNRINGWTRPIEWLELPTIQRSDNKFVGLYAVYENFSNYLVLDTNYGLDVDFGDGNVISGVSDFGYEYDYNSTPGAVYQDGKGENYKQVIVEISVQSPGASQWRLFLDRNGLLPTPASGYGVNFLDFSVATDLDLDLIVGNRYYMPLLERASVDVPSIVGLLAIYATNMRVFDLKNTVINNTASSSAFFRSRVGGALCRNGSPISVLELPLSTSLNSAFREDNSLFDITIDSPLNTDLQTSFLNCYRLRRLVFIDCSLVTSINTLFVNSCFNLQILRMPNISVSFSVSLTAIKTNEMEQLFTDLADLTGVGGATITITGTPAAADVGLNTAIATAKNWTVVL